VKNINKKIELVDLGLIDYKEAWDFQEDKFSETIEIKKRNRNQPKENLVITPNYLILCEHPHVYTLGKSGNPENLLLNDGELTEKKIDYYPINRGGDITYHGPGQIVVYPIIDLENFFTDIHKYLRHLEEAVIMTLREYNLMAGRIEGLTGVWVDHQSSDPRKICAIGVKTSRWVTMHGLAFNINTDLSYYDHIIPCGIDDKAVTSLAAELNLEQDLGKAKSLLTKHLIDLFEMEPTHN